MPFSNRTLACWIHFSNLIRNIYVAIVNLFVKTATPTAINMYFISQKSEGE
jgi:hypothetical protein